MVLFEKGFGFIFKTQMIIKTWNLRILFLAREKSCLTVLFPTTWSDWLLWKMSSRACESCVTWEIQVDELKRLNEAR